MITNEQKKQIELENNKISINMHHIKHRIVIFSGKGGVGKTTVSVNLTLGLYLRGNRTGILDADVTGPNVPKMIGAQSELHFDENKIIPQEKHGVKLVSMANVLPPNEAVLWRGPMRSKLLNQFLGDVAWGDLDYLVADLPPGTGDEILTITQKMEPDLAIIVTTPQEVSLIDSGRAINMAKKMQVPRIAVIENMAGFNCPECGHQIDLFGSGGGRKQAKEMGVGFLGFIPISIKVRQLGDEGRPNILDDPESEISKSFMGIVDNIEKLVKAASVLYS